MEVDIYTGVLTYKNIEFTFVFDKNELRLVPPANRKQEVERWFYKSLGDIMYTLGDPIYIDNGIICWDSCNAAQG